MSRLMFIEISLRRSPSTAPSSSRIVTDLVDLFLGQVRDLLVGIDARAVQERLGRGCGRCRRYRSGRFQPAFLGGKSTPAIRAIDSLSYPCRCLCFGLVQITRTTPSRWMILHLSQIFLSRRPDFHRTALPRNSNFQSALLLPLGPGRVLGGEFHQQRHPSPEAAQNSAGRWRRVGNHLSPASLNLQPIGETRKNLHHHGAHRFTLSASLTTPTPTFKILMAGLSAQGPLLVTATTCSKCAE